MEKIPKNILFAIIAVILLVISSALMAVFIVYRREDPDVTDVEKIIRPENYTALLTKTYKEMQQMDLPRDFPYDDRILPDTREKETFCGIIQAVFCEIVRIRARGIEELIRKPGLEWRTPPSFYYVIKLQDAEHKSREFSTWDTEFIRHEIFRKVKNETETADVTISIIEEQSRGPLGLRSQVVEVETISLEYCFRTGRWTGDNYFGHPDGYGRYLGENYEIWFNLRQSDYDDDGIPFWVENNILMTDPKKDDSGIDYSDDGIPITWEWRWGFDPFTWTNHSEIDISNDGLSNIDKYNLKKWHADPYQPEIYVEVDFMKNTRFFGLAPDFVFWEESKQLIIDKFSQRSYHKTPWASKITVQFDDGHMGGGGEMLPHVKGPAGMTSGVISEFYKNNFADERKGVFRYLVMGDGTAVGKVVAGGWNQPQDYKGWYDTIWVGTSQFNWLAWYRGFNVRPQLQRLAQAITVMHEMGHTLGMSPSEYPGIDNATEGSINYWKNYRSCMNYNMMYRPFINRFRGKDYDGLVLDYSDGSRDEPGRPDRNDWGMIDLAFFKKSSYRSGIDYWEEPT